MVQFMRRLVLILLLAVTVTVPWMLMHPSASGGDEQYYVYDPLGRLYQVIDAAGSAATYHYDAVGNLLAITRMNTQGAPVVTGITPSSARAGETVDVEIRGESLLGASLSTTYVGLAISNVTAAPTQITATFALAETAAQGTATIQVTTASGSATMAFTVLPLAPPLALSPAQVFVEVGKTASLTVSIALTDPYPYEVPVILSVANSAIATVSPTQVTLPPGQTSAPLTVTGVAWGSTVVEAKTGSQSTSANIEVAQAGLYFFWPPSTWPASFTLLPGEALSIAVYLFPPAVVDVVVSFRTTDPAVATVSPSQVIIPAGQNSASATLTGVGDGVTTLIATDGTYEARATVYVGTAM
jgi:YD repeat-containing protein